MAAPAPLKTVEKRRKAASRLYRGRFLRVKMQFTLSSSFPKLGATGLFGMCTASITASRTNLQGPVSATHAKRTSPPRGDNGRSHHSPSAADSLPRLSGAPRPEVTPPDNCCNQSRLYRRRHSSGIFRITFQPFSDLHEAHSPYVLMNFSDMLTVLTSP